MFETGYFKRVEKRLSNPCFIHSLSIERKKRMIRGMHGRLRMEGNVMFDGLRIYKCANQWSNMCTYVFTIPYMDPYLHRDPYMES